MDNIISRIRKVFNDANMSQSALARELNVTPAYIWKLLNKDDALPSDRFIKDICEELFVNEDWLRYGNGEPYISDDREAEIAKITVDLFNSEPESFKYRLITAIAKMNENDLEALERLVLELAKK